MRPYYERDGITIYCADAARVIPSLVRRGDVDVVVTDPPYGIAHSSGYSCPTTTAAWMHTEIHGDESTRLRDETLDWFDEWACFGSPDALPPHKADDVLIWDKGPASGMGDLSWPWKRSWEIVFVRGRGWSGSRDEGVLKGHSIVTRASMGRVHPNEKPVGLLAYLIGKHNGQVILDPFMGSGTTLFAAKLAGRKAIGIEIEERYCEIAARRLAQGVLSFQVTPDAP